jgi:hypothetical protein
MNIVGQFGKQHEIGSGMPTSVPLPVHRSRHIPSINYVLDRNQWNLFLPISRSNCPETWSRIPETTINKRNKSKVPFPRATAVANIRGAT